ncbi:MAG: SMP-30/gluconolactonase/LRE family protein [Myxococcota bacterium]|jgi:sugar lactone lactonase YvrE
MCVAQLEPWLDGFAFLEGPRWHAGRLWFSDMHAQRVYAASEDGAVEAVARVPECPSGLGWLPDGRLLVVSMEDRKLLRREPDGELVTHADLSAVATYHCNDLVVDARGRAYVGNFGFDLHTQQKPRAAKLALVQPDGAVSVAASALEFPNGAVITPDGHTLIVAESFGRRLSAFEIDAASGALSKRRVWAALSDGAVPDGICLDAEGAIWVASPMSRELVRVHEGGRVSQRIACGERMAIACMLGGADRRTLFALTSTSIEPGECRRTRSARIERLRVDVPGAGLP